MRPWFIVLALAAICAGCGSVAAPSEVRSKPSTPSRPTTWQMVQHRLPPDVAIVVGGDGPDVGRIYELIRAFSERLSGDHEPTVGECTFGEWNGFVYAVDASDRGVMFINLKAPIAESAWATCLDSVIEKNPGWKLEVGAADELGIVEFRVLNLETSYLRYAAALDQNILALPLGAADRRLFEEWLRGSGVASDSELGKLVRKVEVPDVVWGVVPGSKRR